MKRQSKCHTKRQIFIVTHADAADGVADDKLLAAAIAKMGVTPRFAVWNDSSVNWSQSDVTVVRSVWDYHLHPRQWFSWLDRVSGETRLVNPAALQKWNVNKHYLLDLAAKGINIIPTASPTSEEELLTVCQQNHWVDIIIKPTIGASSFGAKRFSSATMQEGAQHLNALLKNSEVIVQPYQTEVETKRERSLVYINNRFSHAFSKPAFHSDLGNQSLEIHRACDEEKQLAEKVLQVLPAKPNFARVDVLPCDSGIALMELELIEPELALHFNSSSAAWLAESLIENAIET